jgi:hypothetical protein
MSRRRTTVKHLVELYLIIVGGAYTLAGAVELVCNTQITLQSSDAEERRSWSKDVNEALLLLIPVPLIFAAGLGVLKNRPWGLLLVIGIGIVTLSYGLFWELNHPGDFDEHNFTIVLPMTLILIWALLPSTWLQFRQGSVKTS